MPLPVFLQNNSVSPSDSLRASEKHRASSDYSLDPKKRKMEEKDNLRYVSVHACSAVFFYFFSIADLEIKGKTRLLWFL